MESAVTRNIGASSIYIYIYIYIYQFYPPIVPYEYNETNIVNVLGVPIDLRAFTLQYLVFCFYVHINLFCLDATWALG